MSIRIVAAGLFVAILLVAVPSFAADPPPRILAQLDYRAPRGRCPAASILRMEVAQHLGYDTFTDDAPLRIVADIQLRGHTLVAEIGAFTGAHKDDWNKSLRGAETECAELLARMGIAISFYLDPRIWSAEPSEPPRPVAPLPEVSPPPKVELPKVEPPKVEPPKVEAPKPAKGTPLSFEIGLGPQLAFGGAEPAFGMVGHAGLRWWVLSFGLELRYDAPRSAQAPAPFQGARVEASALGGSFVPCFHLSDFFGCALLSGGRIWADVSGVEVLLDRPDRPYFGIGPRLGFEKRFLPWLGLRLYGEALFMAPTFDIEAHGGVLGVPLPLASQVNGAVGVSLMISP